ncbi:MAG: tripartite tricarboxylate transporter substrate binding protein [Burkholderiales bacterium]|nr:tripartite tricarboxylate transporter substrate binding protein [Burkholderiales bacterium]
MLCARYYTIGIVLCSGLAITPIAVQAQSYPTRPIRFVVPYPPGGSTDTYARIIAVKLSEALGQSVVIDNRTGAAGSVGAEIAAKAQPDGYTLVLGQDSNLVIGQAVRAVKNYDTLRDFAPISLVVRTPQVVVVNDSSPFKSIKDLVAAAKAKPGKLTFASAGHAGSSHVMGAFLNIRAGMDTVHVPYKGGGPGMLDLRAGRVDFMVTSMVSSLNFARDGRARLLAITGTKRSHLFPDVPTLGEAGYEGFESMIWHGVLAPARVPQHVVARVNQEVVKALAMPDVQKSLQFEGGTASPSTPEEFRAFIKADVDRWTHMVKQTGIRVD